MNAFLTMLKYMMGGFFIGLIVTGGVYFVKEYIIDEAKASISGAKK